jgi:hypothetical protein
MKEVNAKRSLIIRGLSKMVSILNSYILAVQLVAREMYEARGSKLACSERWVAAYIGFTKSTSTYSV